MRKKRWAWTAVTLMACMLVFGACTATQPRMPVTIGDTPGFWRGFWHGLIAPIAFIVSLFSHEVRIYAFPNAGGWYDFGFMLGIGGFSGGVFASRKRPKEREK